MGRRNNLPQLHRLPRVDFTSWRLKLVICLLLAAGTIAAFQGLRTHEFISYDDRDYITINMFDRNGLTWKNVQWAFHSVDSEGHWIAGNYHPLTWISTEIDISLFGTDNPNVSLFGWHTGLPSSGFHHLMDLFFHVVSTILLFLLLCRLLGRPWVAAFVAALFALHPLHIQSVAWASERKDVLSTVFFMLTIMTYVTYADRGGRSRWFWYALTFVLYGLGLLAKSMLVTLPLVLMLLDFWPLGRLKFAADFAAEARPKTPAQAARRERRSRADEPPSFLEQLVWSFIEKIPLFFLTVLDARKTFEVQGSAGAVVGEQLISGTTRVGTAILSYVGYLYQMFWPTDLSFFYSYREDSSPGWVRDVILALLFLAVLTSLVLYFGRKYRYLPVGWLWYLGILIPANGLFVQVGSQSHADRYTYVPYIGIFLIITLVVADLRAALVARRPDLRVAATAALAVLAVAGVGLCGWLTNDDLHMWKNDESIYTQALKLDPNNAVAHNNWGGMIYQTQARTKAEQAARLAAEAQNLAAGGHQAEADAKRAESARLSAEAGERYDTAEAHFAKAVELKPGYADALANLGMLTFERHAGQNVPFSTFDRQHAIQLGSAMTGKESTGLQKTELCYLIALAVKADHPGALNNIGNLYRTMSQQAEQEEQKAQQEGRTADAQRNHDDAVRYRKAAEARYRFAVRAKPDLLEAHANLAVFLEAEFRRQIAEAQRLSAQGQAAEAAAANQKADAAFTEAVYEYRLASQCDPKSARVHGQLASLLFERNHYAEALPEYYAAFRLGETPPMALASVAWILATASDNSLRNGPEALKLAQQAVQGTNGKFAPALDTLAAAYAECGRFDEAISTEQQSITLAQSAGQGVLIPLCQQHLQSYQNHQPFRTPAVPPPAP